MLGRSGLDIRLDMAADSIAVLSPAGILDSSSYMTLRLALVKATTGQVDAVLVDVDRLVVPVGSAWAVLTSAQWMVSAWPAVPICGITTKADVLSTVTANGISRYVPFFPSRQAAVAAVQAGNLRRRYRLRVTEELPRHAASHSIARALIQRTLIEWSHPHYTAAAQAIATELIGNVLAHTESAPRLSLELSKSVLTVAVADDCPDPAVRKEPVGGTVRFSGLGVVSLLSRVWGCHPSGNGKVVWANIDRGNEEW